MRLRTLFSALACLTVSSAIAHADPIDVGATAPGLSATTETGDTITLADIYAKGITLVYFYPKADTPGCTAQACSLRDAYTDLADKGITVVGVSVDDVASQKAFKEKYHLPFTLIADHDKKVMTAFGVPDWHGLATRQAFLMDKGGKVVWRDLKASTKEQAADVLKALAALKSS